MVKSQSPHPCNRISKTGPDVLPRTILKTFVGSGPALPRWLVCCAIISMHATWAWTSEIAASPDELTPAEVRFFERKVRPVLIQYCYECHSTGAKPVQGGLRLDSREGIRKGGDSGPAVVPGNVDRSLVIQSVRHESFEMPPQGRLPDHVINDLIEWVAMGAPDPREAPESRRDTSQTNHRDVDPQAGRPFWSFQPPKKRPAPSVNNHRWPSHSIDRFVLHRLEREGLRPADDADPRALVRRIYFDLVGLPPPPDRVDTLVNDPSPAALAQLVDRLLASPHFGERWGRHWLDVTRYAESSGGGRSLMFDTAWRFRDYVIRSFNEDKPYDQIVREHIAGDLLPYDSPDARRQQLTASGFLVLGPINYELQDKELLRMEVVDEQISTMGSAFLGMTLGCARCHDHKFDPIPTTDYYALAGIFRSTKSLIPGNVSRYVERPLPVSPEHDRALGEYERSVGDLKKKLDRCKSELKMPNGTAGGRSRLAAARLTLQRLTQDLKVLEGQAPPPRPTAMSVEDYEKPEDCHVCIRGNVRNLGPKVPRHFLRVATPVGDRPTIPPRSSGRLELADWLTRPDNPLTARVMVNRIWHYLFGEGLVRTPDNFGATGERPTHPELLDYLAVTFVEEGWSVKNLIRQIVLSRTYRLSSDASRDVVEIDPDNRLLARANRRRLDAESIRDAMLAVSGQLDLTAGGLTIRKVTQYDLAYQFDSVRRSVYVPWFRNSRLDLFDVFDGANPNTVTGHRNVSTLATQSLYLMNSPFVAAQSRHAARRLLADPSLDPSERIERAFRRALGRPPTDAERELALSYVRGANGGDPEIELEAWAGIYHLLFACVDFVYLD